MPLIIITGYPCSGKTKRAIQIRDFFIDRIAAAQAAQKSGLSAPTTPGPVEEDGDGLEAMSSSASLTVAEIARIARLKVHLVNIDCLEIERGVYREARSEKEARATEYSAIKRLLSKDDIVISDSLNYIKGYRYQLYCEAKAVLTPSCVVHIGTPPDLCRQWNNERKAKNMVAKNIDMYITPCEGERNAKQFMCAPAYPDDILENLIFRYEEPNRMARWDSPLFTVPYMDEQPDLNAIWDACMEEGITVRPNKATVLKPAAESNYLYELDKTTQEVVTHILDAQKNGITEGELKVPECNISLELPPSSVTLPQLQRIRRQYISLNRQHAQAKSRIRELFVNYLNQNLN